jgi:hypothetical protein
VQNLQGSIELMRIDPAQLPAFDFAVGEIAKVAGGIAGICDGNIARARGRRAASDVMSFTRNISPRHQQENRE